MILLLFNDDKRLYNDQERDTVYLRIFNDVNGKQTIFSPTFRRVDGQHVYLAYRLAILRNRY